MGSRPNQDVSGSISGSQSDDSAQSDRQSRDETEDIPTDQQKSPRTRKDSTRKGEIRFVDGSMEYRRRREGSGWSKSYSTNSSDHKILI